MFQLVLGAGKAFALSYVYLDSFQGCAGVASNAAILKNKTFLN